MTYSDVLPQQLDSFLLESSIRDIRKTVTLLEELSPKSGVDNDGNLPKFTIVVHGIKSSLGNIGETELSGTAYKLEIGAREKNIGLITAETPEFLSKLRALLEKLEPKLNDDGVDNDIDGLCKKLRTICEMCADYNRKNIFDLIADIKDCSKKTRTVLENVKEYVIHSDFEKAACTAAEYAADLNGRR